MNYSIMSKWVVNNKLAMSTCGKMPLIDVTPMSLALYFTKMFY